MSERRNGVMEGQGKEM